MRDTGSNDIGGGVTLHTVRSGGRLRRRGPWVWVLAAVLVIAVAVGVFFIIRESQKVAVVSISPVPDSAVSAAPVTVSCELSHYEAGEGALALSVDGVLVPAGGLAIRDGLVQAQVELADGPHTVAFVHESGGFLSQRVARSWSFVVDRTPPQLTVQTPSSFPRLGARSSALTVSLSEPGSASLTLDGADVRVSPSAADDSEIKATLIADEGRHVLGFSVTDRAGNTTTRSWDLTVDYRAPELTAEGLPDGEVWNDHNAVAVALVVSDKFADQVTVQAILDGVPLALREPDAASSSDKRTFGFETGTMPEGTHMLEVSVTDPGGHVTRLEREFLVDTSAVFGNRTLKIGALGEDVKQLQRILKIKGVYAGDPTGLLDDVTAAAVATFNSQYGIAGGHVVTQETLKYLLGYIRIDLSERKLYLYDGADGLLATYRVAVGMSSHPTPTGDFRIMSKAKNPIWNPPDSAWAEGMGPVPPGPENPLGTRWMGLNSPGIGIHGTPAPSSIGTAASHGCIRMKIPEVEDLFDRVFVGTSVEIVE